MKEYPLVILAAGLGSRYGGLKQLSDISGKDEAIIDFSIYDAIEAGFNCIIFIIRKETEALFKLRYKNKFPKNIKVKFLNQEITSYSRGFDVSERKKPWGTAHALLMLKGTVTDPFLLINADDFYGSDNFKLAFKLLKEDRVNYQSNHLIAYNLINTLSKFGKVSRGVCKMGESELLEEIIERSAIHMINGECCFTENKDEHPISKNEKVSMNLWVLSPMILSHLEMAFLQFLRTNLMDPNAEFFIPSIINELIKEKKIKVMVENATDSWFGITYKEDLAIAKSKIEALRTNFVYPDKLY